MNSQLDSSGVVGSVVIGRNEGERLKICLKSVVTGSGMTVYVDSGSSDDSISLAKDLGVEVVELDMSVPFTAARARNAGYEYLHKLAPGILYVQFIDGDCELDANWISTASYFLEANPDVAVVCGRRRERYPERSVYNLLCDIEWDSPTGQVKSCGGDSLMRVQAFTAVGGFRDDLIAGEEPELCVRLRQANWKVWRLSAEMTLHDADMTRFYQWWKRSIRGGYAFAQGAWLHGKAPEYHNVKESRRIWFWGAGLPMATGFSVILAGSIGWLLLALYPLQILRLGLKSSGRTSSGLGYAFFLTLGKFPEMLGHLKFYFYRVMRIKARLIEYK